MDIQICSNSVHSARPTIKSKHKGAELDFNIISLNADRSLQLDSSPQVPLAGGDTRRLQYSCLGGICSRFGPGGSTIQMKVKTLSAFIKAALGPHGSLPGSGKIIQWSSWKCEQDS